MEFRDAFGVLRVRTCKFGNGFGVVGGAGIELAAPFNGGFCFARCAGFGAVAADQEDYGGED